jgi:hypothetical protein
VDAFQHLRRALRITEHTDLAFIMETLRSFDLDMDSGGREPHICVAIFTLLFLNILLVYNSYTGSVTVTFSYTHVLHPGLVHPLH